MQDGHAFDALTLRLDRLERQNRRLRRAVLGAVALPFALAGLLAWRPARPEVLEASLVRTDRLEVNVGEGYEFSVGAAKESSSAGMRPIGPYVTMRGKSGSINLSGGNIFVTSGEDEKTMNTVVTGGHVSCYPNLGPGPSVRVGADSGEAGLRVFPFNMSATNWPGNNQMLAGIKEGYAGLFFSGPDVPPTSKQTTRLPPPSKP